MGWDLSETEHEDKERDLKRIIQNKGRFKAKRIKSSKPTPSLWWENSIVELIPRVFALLVHDLEQKALILALKWHIILSRCVQWGTKERKSSSRVYLLSLWAWFPESWIKMIWNEKKRVDVSNYSNEVI